MRSARAKWLFIGLLIVVTAGGLYQYFRPLPGIAPLGQTPTPPKTQGIALPWPSSGQAALGANGYGVLEAHGGLTPVSTASIAKVFTAIAVLQKKPLAAGSQGPTITLDQTDVDYFNYYYSRGGTVANVKVGEQITEYQLLQAMLLPSANNVADTLARWAFGSIQAYVTYANQMVKNMGLAHTTVNNTNGFDDTTTSTADDLVKLGLEALKVPVIADVVNQKSASIPVEGQINNVNWLLGDNGVVGIKTGNTDKAGGCYLFAARHQILGRQVILVGAVLGSSNLTDAITAGRNLASAADSGFQKINVIARGQVLGSYHAPWGANSQLKAGQDLSLTVWKGKEIVITSDLEPAAAPAPAGAAIGSVHVTSGSQSISSPLYLSQDLAGPSWRWRLLRS
ncbi:MAG TPA: serine hydrolase [Candidatus Saccharimonadales bacterium]|nr:serine hydrolase [Candidatus Saccharimonadales bacterium]